MALFRLERTSQLLYKTINLTNARNLLAYVSLPKVRYASNDASTDFVVDCSGSSCTTIKIGMMCAPGTEEYCILGHMPGGEGHVTRDRPTTTPIQAAAGNEQYPEAEAEEGHFNDYLLHFEGEKVFTKDTKSPSEKVIFL